MKRKTNKRYGGVETINGSNKNKRGSFWIVMSFILMILVVSGLSILYFGYGQLRESYNELVMSQQHFTAHQNTQKDLIKKKQPFSILVVGLGDNQLGNLDQERQNLFYVVQYNPTKQEAYRILFDENFSLSNPLTKEYVTLKEAYRYGGYQLVNNLLGDYLDTEINHHVEVRLSELANQSDTFSDFVLKHIEISNLNATKEVVTLPYKEVNNYIHSGKFDSVDSNERWFSFFVSFIDQGISVEEILNWPTIIKNSQDYIVTDVPFSSLLKLIHGDYATCRRNVVYYYVKDQGIIKIDNSNQVEEIELDSLKAIMNRR